jgi:ABC-type nitrate/sulfonate/bicarbonate transport system substrate-binding protein
MMIKTARVLVLFLVTLAALLCVAAPVAAQKRSKPELWIASGLPGGTYRSVYAVNLERLMPDYKFYYHKSTGSADNLELLAAGKADLAFAQADVYAAKLAARPGEFEDLLVLGKLAEECLYLVYRRNGKLTAFDQLLEEPEEEVVYTLAAGDAKGGMSGTWDYIVSIKPELAHVKVDHMGDTLALNQLAVGRFDMVGWVTDPTNYQHKLLEATLANQALQLMNVKESTLVSALPDGTQIYHAKTVKLDEGWRAAKLNTICTSGLLFARRDADPKLLNKVADLISLDIDRIVPKK